METREQLLGAVRARVRQAAEAGVAATVLDAAATAEAHGLAQLMDGARDLAAGYALGCFHLLRANALPAADAGPDREAALRYFLPPFIAGAGGIPASLYPQLAQRAAPTARQVFQRACATGADPALLSTAVTLWRRIAGSVGDSHSGYVAWQSALAGALQTRFERSGDPADLDEAATAARAALHAVPPGDANRAGCLSNLGTVLRTRFAHGGDTADLEEAVEVNRAAAGSVPPEHPDHPGLLSNLCVVLRDLYDHSEDPAVLDEAVEAGRAAVQAEPQGHPQRADVLSNLRRALRSRYIRTQDPADLDEAVSCARQAVEAAPPGHPDHAEHQQLLSGLLYQRHDRTKEPRDLDEAITTGRAALRATPPGHADRAASLSNLGNMLRTRFAHTQDPRDLAEGVESARAAVGTASADDRGHAGRLSNLSLVLEERFEQTDDPADLDEAVAVGRAAVEAAPPGHPDRALCLVNLSRTLDTRSTRKGTWQDLDEAIELSRTAAGTVQTGHRDAAVPLSRLGVLLGRRFELKDDPDDLAEALAAARAAVRAAPGHYARLADLGIVLHQRFARTGDLAHLNEVIEVCRTAAGLVRPDDPQRVGCLTNLGLALHGRFERSGSLADLDEAIELYRAAVRSAPQGRPSVPALHNLGDSLRTRFARTGDLTDLDEAIEAGRAATGSMPKDHPDRGAGLTNLGLALRDKYGRTGDARLLDTAVEACRAAVRAHPEGHPVLAVCLNNLGTVLRTRFHSTRDLVDLDASVEAGRATVRATPGDHPDHALRLTNFASVLRERFELTGDPADLDEAVMSGRTAADSVPPDHPDHAMCLLDLGIALRKRYELTRRAEDLREALSVCEQVTENTATSPRRRIGAARVAADLAASAQPSLAAALLEKAVRTLPEVAGRRLRRSDQQHVLGSSTAGLAADATALALADTEGDARERAVRALRMAEAGRAVLLSQALDARSDLTELQQRHPELAERFVHLRERLDEEGGTTGGASGGHDLTDTGSTAGGQSSAGTGNTTNSHGFAHSASTSGGRRFSGAGRERHRFATELEEVIGRIRACTGFADFGLPPSLDTLMAEAVHGPVVTFNVSHYRSDALLLTRDGVSALPLPALTRSAVVERSNTFHRALAEATAPAGDRIGAQRELSGVLAWLWEAAAEPVLAALDLTEPQGDDGEPLPRVWWAPGGLLGQLPLHAAGHHTDPGPRRRTVMDRVVSSYTPTIRTLHHARARRPRPASDSQSLIVAMPTTPGRSPLPHVPEEARRVRALLHHPLQLTGAAPTLEASGDGQMNAADGDIPTTAGVLARLPQCAIAHFACHGADDRTDPSRSRLLLHDHATTPLTVAALARTDLDRAQLAYLSACSTAAVRNPLLLDEAIHLTSAFQLAGFPHVVGTLWPIDDRLAAEIAESFYLHLSTGTPRSPDPGRSAVALHHTIRAVRDRYPATPSLWAAYLHAGA
ncbi:CHAT domain-containing protein [Streptomyces monticola]|uniref:CHAT domain-containing protein n=1 Tax=Streptomyces monticola TaxID=2666263 RepID=A0ABW2JD63_9ACTN